MKKWIQVIWVAVLVMLLGVTVVATDDALSGSCGDALVWKFDPATATLTISGTGDMIDYSTFEGGTQPWGNYSIDKIIITEGVTSIGEYAFYKLDSASLTSVIIPASIKKIGENAFAECSYIKDITFQGDAPELEPYPFLNTSTEFTIHYYSGTTGWDNVTWNAYTLSEIKTGGADQGTVTNPQPTSVSYTVSLSAVNQSVKSGDIFRVNISVDNAFTAAEIAVSHTENLTFSSRYSTLNGAEITKSEEGLSIADFGAEQAAGIAYTLAFEVQDDTKMNEDVTVTVTSAAFDIGGNAALEDLREAALTDCSVTLKAEARRFSVSLPQIFDGYSEVAEGGTYTFTILDTDGRFYDYGTVTATEDGQEKEVAANSDGSYSITDVKGDLVIRGERTAKKYTVTVTHPEKPSGYKIQYNETAVYGTDYDITVPYIPGYKIRLSEVKYKESGTRLLYTMSTSAERGITYRIDGYSITGDLYFIFDSTASEMAVDVQGTGIADAVYESEAVYNQAFVLTLHMHNAYEYTVSATVNGQTVELVREDNTYTIAAENVTGAIVFHIDKTLKMDHVDVEAYASAGSKNIYLVLYPADKLEDKVYCYQDTRMFWSDQYAAYCILVIADVIPNPDTEEFSLCDGTVTVVSAGSGDVNKSNCTDANDAQFIYNMYNGAYDSFDIVPMERFLSADINGDGIVNVNDAAAVIYMIFNPN